MKTRILTTIFALLAIATTAQAQFGGGSGSYFNPYIISTTDHWTELANNVNGGNNYRYKYFRLENNLDFTGKPYTIIGDQNVNVNAYFAGKFDGNGKTIEGVNLDRTSTVNNSVNIGLFGRICYEATVENLTLSNSTIKGRVQVGGIVGSFYDFYSSDPNVRSVVRNCHVTSDVTIETVDVYDYDWQPSGNVGSIVGRLDGDRGSVSDCTSAATIKASSRSVEVGGIVGATPQDGNIISGCAYTGSISSEGTSYVGGIVGGNYRNSTITDNFVGGNCTIGAVGVAGSTQGTDAGYEVTHIYTIGFNSAQYVSGTIATQPTMTIGSTDYYASGSTVTLSSLSTFGSPTAGNIWSFRATVSHSYYEEVFRQEDGTWQFTMPMGNATISPEITKDISLYTTSVTLTPASATYTGSSHKPTVGVMCRARDLTEGTDFITDIPTAGYTNPGDYTFHIWGIGDYGGMRTETFTVSPAALTQLTLSETSVYHDGAAHKPTLTVKSGSKTLTRGTEYETDLPDAGFTDLGDYTIKVWGIGNYGGELSATYTVCHPWNGMGTQQEPFLIQNEDDMDRLATLVNGGKSYNGVYFRQEADLDFTGRTYTPVGNYDDFQGTFDGYYHNITGITVSGQEYIGVFGWVGPQGTIRSVTLTGTNSFSGAGQYTGAIAGYNQGNIESCHVMEGANVTVTATDNTAGGIVGWNFGTVNSCVNYAANVTASCAGGIVGRNNVFCEIYGTNYATVTGTSYCGGICGKNMGIVSGQHYGTIVCQNNSTKAGGIVGLNGFSGEVENCLSTDLMTSLSGTNKGAIAGWNRDDDYANLPNGTITNCYYIGACKFGGIEGTDVTGQAMRGWPISHDESIGFHPIADASGNFIGTYYDDGTNNYYYVGAGETLRFILNGGSGYTANGTALVVAGHDDDWDEDYYELTMAAEPVHIAPTGLMLTLYDNWVNNHNIDDITDALGETRNVVIEGRTLYKTGIWNTICLPFALANFSGTPLEDATVKELASSSYNASTQTLTLNFSTVSEIEAGKPYIVKWASGENIENPVFENVVIGSATASSAETDYIDFVGCYSIESLAAQDRMVLYMGGDSKLYYPGSDMKVNAFRGFFRLKKGLTAGNLPNSAKAIVLDFGDETTSLNEELRMKSEESVGDWYSIDGRKLNGKPTAKGIYIHKGKKIVK